LGFRIFFKKPNWFYGRTVKEPKLWGLGFLTNSFGFLRSIIMSENQSFEFLKISSHGSIIPRPYLQVFSTKKEEDRMVFCFGKCFFFKMAKFKVLKVFSCQI
jgi:hypothetical protein